MSGASFEPGDPRARSVWTLSLRDLTAAGWVLALASLACGVLVCIPIGAWALDGIENSVFRKWNTLICIALAIPGFAISLVVFLCARRVARSAGVRVTRARDSSAA